MKTANILIFSFLLLSSFGCNNECKNVSCLNGICQDGTCFCENGWTGENCDCEIISCLNSGTFNSDNCNCDCPEDCIGELCEICPELVSFTPSSKTFLCPDHVGGNRNFSGNGPLAELEVSFYIDDKKENFKTTIIFSLTETEHDWTTAGKKWDFSLWKAPEGYEILSIENDSSTERRTTIDRDHEYTTFFYENCADEVILNNWGYVGDTSGDDVGDCGDGFSFLNVYFCETYLKIRKRP